MRSCTNSNEAPQRRHGRADERRQVNVDVNVDAVAGWPLGRHGKHSPWSVEGPVASKAGNSLDHVEERHGAAAQMSSGPAENRSCDALAHEVEELLHQQPQFAFLKPCRQLEKHYANRRNAGQCHPGNSSFRHDGSGSTVTTATTLTEDGDEATREVRGVSSAQRRDAHQKPESRTPLATDQLGPDHVDAKPRRGSRREFEGNSRAPQCRLRDSDAKPGSTTIRDLLSTDAERGFRGPASDHHVRVLNHHDATRVTSSSHPSSVSVSLKCEEDSARPQSIAAAAQGALARKSSRDGIELNSFLDEKSASRGATSARVTGKVAKQGLHQDVGLHEASPRRSVSERFYGRGHFHRNSGEKIWRISSTRCSIHEKEAHIDLVAPAAAKFLVETSDSPSYTPARHYNASPPAVAVPFKWEDAPGRAKLETAARKPADTLQLPPRLAVPLQRSGESFSRELRVSVVSTHPLAGLFPCMTASSPSRPQQPHDSTWMHQQRASRNLPPKQSHPHHGYGGHPEATLPKSGDRRDARKLNKSFSQPLTSTVQPGLNVKPRRLFSSELKGSHPWMGMQQSGQHSDPTSILHSGRQSSSSRTYLSCELDASTPRTAGSKSSSSASYESIGEDFDHDENASPSSCTHKAPHSFDSGATASDAEPPPGLPPSHGRRAHPHRSEGVKGLLKLCKSHGNCLRKSKSRSQRLGPLCSPEVWAPTLATYFQRLDVHDEPAMHSGLLDTHGAPTSSGYLNSHGEPVALDAQQPRSPELLSPDRPTRLPYKMPSVAEQERSAEQERAARNSQTNSRAGRSHARSPMDVCPSPAYTAALEMLSPAVNLMASRRHRHGARHPPWPGSPKPHRRVQFILSICKTLKRVLFRQQPRRSVIGTRLMYHDERAPTTFQFSKPN